MTDADRSLDVLERMALDLARHAGEMLEGKPGARARAVTSLRVCADALGYHITPIGRTE